MIRPSPIPFALLLPLATLAQPSSKAAAPPPLPVAALQGGWDAGTAKADAAQWKDAAADAPADAAILLNWFLSTRNAKAICNNGKLKAADQDLLQSIAGKIMSAAPGSFEQHVTGYYLSFPYRSAFFELDAAYALEPVREELISPKLSEAMLEGHAAGIIHWSTEMEHRGGIAPSLLLAAEDLLSSVGPGGILFTNGNMDTQPAVVRQTVYGQRPDVLIVDRRLLEDTNYRAYIWAQAGAHGIVPPAGVAFAEALAKASDRPVHLALSLDRDWLDAFAGHLHAVGAAFRVGAPSPADAEVLEQNWASMHKPMDAGPMSRNYLLPGAMLLAHYRQTGDTAKAQALEVELRRMAIATGAVGDLKKLGVLPK